MNLCNGHTWNRAGSRRGNAMLGVMVTSAIAAFIVGKIMFNQWSDVGLAETSYAHDRAFYMAEAGMSVALAKVNDSDVPSISLAQSQAYFANANDFSDATTWGFQVALTTGPSGTNYLSSTGQYNGEQVTINAAIALFGGIRDIHAMYAHAIYAGNSSHTTNYTLQVGGTNPVADFVNGDVYASGNIAVTGNAKLRLPEILNDYYHDGVCHGSDTWQEAYCLQTFTTACTVAQFNAYSNSMAAYTSLCYKSASYVYGEAFIDTIGYGHYVQGDPYTDSNSNGVWDAGDPYTDLNGDGNWDPGEPYVDEGNGRWDPGEQWIEDELHVDKNGVKVRLNSKYDYAGGYYTSNATTHTWTWNTPAWAAYSNGWVCESFEDLPCGSYTPGEPYVDQNGVYDVGEVFFSDRNGIYDYGTQATGTITGMPTPGVGQRASTGHDTAVDPPDLVHMYYNLPKTGTAPTNALDRWGYDIMITNSLYGTHYCITSVTNPAHIFLKNPGNTSGGSVSDNGKTIYNRLYAKIKDKNNNTIDDYFLEDCTDSYFNSYDTSSEIDGTVYTAPEWINITTNGNMKVYYICGNLYLDSPRSYGFRFRQPGTFVTFVVLGNITVSDSLIYNANYKTGLNSAQWNSTAVISPKDAVCMIALTNAACTNSGCIYFGDPEFGTGGASHGMYYAQNDFLDANLAAQANLSIFGNMSAGDLVSLMRSNATQRTRLDVTLDDRIRSGTVIVPGLPHPIANQQAINLPTAWDIVPGSWFSPSRL